MTYRSDLDALEARHTALDAEVSRATTERDRTAALLEEAKTRLRLPILDNIRVASPCNASWDDMVGDDQVRHCGACDKDVFNLSNMTREDAEAVITAAAGALCTRYYRRADGTIMTSDCAVGMRRARRRKLIVAGVTVMVAAVGALGYEVLRPESIAHREPLLGAMVIEAPPPPQVVQGGLALPPAPLAMPERGGGGR